MLFLDADQIMAAFASIGQLAEFFLDNTDIARRRDFGQFIGGQIEVVRDFDNFVFFLEKFRL